MAAAVTSLSASNPVLTTPHVLDMPDASSSTGTPSPRRTKVPPSITSSALHSAAAYSPRSRSGNTTTFDRTTALHTPLTSTYPSSIHNLHSPNPMLHSQSAASSAAATPTTTTSQIKRQDAALRTPITPPSAYLDFLKCVSPALSSPASSTHFTFSAVGNLASPYPWSSNTPNSASFPRFSRTASSLPPSVARHRSQSPAASSTPAPTSSGPTSNDSGSRTGMSAPPAPLANTSRPMFRPNAPTALPSNTRQPPTSAPSLASPRVTTPRSALPPTPKLIIPPSPSHSISQPGSSAHPASDSSAMPGKSATSAFPRSAFSAGSGTPTSVRIRTVVKRTVTYTRPLGGTSGVAGRETQSTTPVNLRRNGDALSAKVRSSSEGAYEVDLQGRVEDGLAKVSDDSEEQSDLSGSDISSDDDDDDMEDYQDEEPVSKDSVMAEATAMAAGAGESRGVKRLVGDAPKGKRRKIEE